MSIAAAPDIVSELNDRAFATRCVVLDELDTDGTIVTAEVSVAAALTNTGLVTVEPAGVDRWRVKPCGMVGAVDVGPLRVRVIPKDKVRLSRLLFLLGYAHDPGLRPEDITVDDDDDLLPVLAESLARQVEYATAAGVLQGYVTVEDAERTVRGRIRIGDQIATRPGLLLPLEVTYDDYTADIAENRILRTALRLMRSLPRVDDAVRARLTHLDMRLDGVRLLTGGALVPVWRSSRLNERYHSALRLAELTLRHCSAEIRDGDVPVASFVVSMWTVYEDFVTAALTDALADKPGRTHAQYQDWLDESAADGRPAIRLRPDIVHTACGLPVLAVDAKYKAASPDGRYPNADQYQMLAYCTALRLPRAYLVYAQGADQAVRRIRNTAIEIVEYPLDLSDTPRGLLTQIDRLAIDAWANRAQTTS